MGIKLGREVREPQISKGSETAKKAKTRPLGSKSQERAQANVQSMSKVAKSFRSTSSGSGMSGGNMQVGSVPLDIDLGPMLEGMDYDADDRQLFNLYRDIYFFDPIGGSYVDLFSTLPFSDVSFSGAKDSVLEAYYEVNERLSLSSSMPNITTDLLVTGAFCGSMLYNKERKKFIDLMTHRYDNIEATPFPLMSQDPIFELRVPQDVKRAFSKESRRVDALRKELGAGFVDKMLNENMVELDPIGTIYIPRKTFTFGEGVSAFRRMLPIWLIEKNLYRGTLIESGRRQRGILHAQLGDGDQWEPSQEEMDFITDLLLNADSDPIGSIITTRLGVNISEFRQGGDFWKITDIWDQTASFKMRLLGISEALLSGEANYDSAATGLTVFIESLRAYRDFVTRKVYYEKVFPLISMMNGYAIGKNGKIMKKSGLMDGSLNEIMYRLNDGSKLFIPNVHWSKQLRPDIDSAMMENLRAMTELGVPVPLRSIAAAGGFNFDQLLMDQDEDLALRHKLLAYKKRQQEIDKQYSIEEAAGGDGDSYSSVSSTGRGMQSVLGIPNVLGSQSAVLGGVRRPGLKGRDFGEQSEIFELSKTGKKKHVYRQARANQRANDMIYKTIQNYERNKTMPLDSGLVTHEPTAYETRALRRSGLF
ncbi:putative portal protein [Dickeya phage vB_DsoM_JA33]|uniref:Putative portal protein n=2 Tax=Salmondvirus JA11 TaxID=2734141 RepID=A0A386K516_9CAUD|nr:portal protein [Dickeya phage vB_DsoM_JA11]AXG67379.1 putative portal protein [Dickeya phage vB_DsoM_JA33]AYD79810.1 putative portal protein [Dickeya phage vB_DsoM_JA11]